MSANRPHEKELLLVREANEDADSPTETHLTKKRIASEEFLHKYRKGMPFEGPHPDEMTPEQLQRLNDSWERFFREKRGLIDYFADYDEDLSSIAMLGVRRMIALHPDCPDSWLVQRAKYDIKSARYWGGCIDNGSRRDQRVDVGYVCGDDEGNLAERLRNFFINKQQYRILEELGMGDGVDNSVIDQMTCEEFYASLDGMERQLVDILIDEYRGDWGWYKGEYATHPEKGSGPKQRFKREVTQSETAYVVTYVSVRRKFYERFGSAQEVEREREWCKNWDPTQPIHRNRGTGLYERTGKYAKNKEST
ncbi:hypothetical protein IH992_33370 [Candidatus Poribacteria bacterium]|nr:hypothetical protein [Candidatus Poribacteria bacterium]